jgi:hypothetical protein
MRAAKLLVAASALLMLFACIGGLPRSLRRDIADEHDKLQKAQRQVEQSAQTLRDDFTKSPDLFANVPTPGQWTATLAAAREKLKSAQDADLELQELNRQNRRRSRELAERLLSKERRLRESAITDAHGVEKAAADWIGFAHNLPSHLDTMRRDYDAVHTADLKPVAAVVEKAEHDWPAKKDALDTRLAALRDVAQSAEKEWDATATARQDAADGKVTGPELATLIQTDKDLDQDAAAIHEKSDELRALSEQLYNSWDKILIDLDASRDGRNRVYRERIKTITTHITDVSSHKSETSANEAWVSVSEPAFHAVEDDLGMAIGHKDAGLFDSEAQTTPQPAGFAYIAPESQGSNQYGYWTHSGGHTFWTFLPEYLIMRELLWNHDYRPVAIEDYRGYRSALSTGRSYYGQATPASPPTYGTRGTFTQTHYANSRYMQSGGFRGSAYASHPSQSPSAYGGFGQRSAAPSSDNGAGKRFGSAAGSPSGRRFGHSPGAGRRFGGRRR